MDFTSTAGFFFVGRFVSIVSATATQFFSGFRKRPGDSEVTGVGCRTLKSPVNCKTARLNRRWSNAGYDSMATKAPRVTLLWWVDNKHRRLTASDVVKVNSRD
jgi:hypothetical protein